MLNSQRFMRYSGWFFLILAFAGFLGLGPTPANSLFGQAFYLDRPENIGHLIVGLVALAVLRWAHTDRWLRIWSGVFGVVLLVVAVVGFLNHAAVMPNAGLVNLELPDNIIHLIGALWGFWVAFMPEGPIFVRDEKTKDASIVAL
jgi:hypothetical protein